MACGIGTALVTQIMVVRVETDRLVAGIGRAGGVGATGKEGVPFPGDSDWASAVTCAPVSITIEAERAPESRPEREDFLPVHEHFIAQRDSDRRGHRGANGVLSVRGVR